MRDVLGLPHLRRPLPALARRGMGRACALALALALLVALAAALAAEPTRAGTSVQRHRGAGPAAQPHAGSSHRHRPGRRRSRARHRRIPFSRTPRSAKVLRRQALDQPTLNLKSSFIQRAQVAAMTMPFTLRLRRTYEGGPGDDILELAWDAGAVTWPLAGTAPVAPVTSNLDGAMTYEWDYGADTTGYAGQGTVETSIGAGISMQGTGFAIAGPGADPCDTVESLRATGMALTAAGARFGTVNPFSGAVSGTISFRTAIRTEAVPCGGGTPATGVTSTAAPDPPLPVAFTGRFVVSPSITGDGRIRFGFLQVDDTVIPQRTTFGLVHVCADPAAADGCGRAAFPVRTKFRSFTAEVLAGDAMPPAPTIPDEQP